MALASDYKLVDFTASLDLAQFTPHHLIFTADYVKNVGFDRQKVEELTQRSIEEKSAGYQLKFTYGWPHVTERRRWNTSIAYKYLERDAVLDAFTDSDFHLGGTDAKGYILGADYGLLENTWVSMRYLSANAIDGVPLAIDVLQIDINAKF